MGTAQAPALHHKHQSHELTGPSELQGSAAPAFLNFHRKISIFLAAARIPRAQHGGFAQRQLGKLMVLSSLGPQWEPETGRNFDEKCLFSFKIVLIVASE